MYIKTHCTQCGNIDYHYLKMHATRGRVKNVEATDSISEEDLVLNVMHTIRGHLHNGIEVRELCGILKTCYGIGTTYCCGLIQRIQIELDMYSPDKRHLYFVDPFPPQ
jgi:hypothetical protein